MTEEQWLACDDPVKLLASLPVPVSPRKVTHYLCAGARSLWPLLYDDRSRQAVEVLEREADGEASAKEVADADYYAESPTFGYHFASNFVRLYRGDEVAGVSVGRLLAMGAYTEEDLAGEAEDLGDDPTRLRLVGLAHIVYHAFHAIEEGELYDHLLDHLSAQEGWPGGGLVREVFGDPFRPAALVPSWLTPTVLALAEAAYDERVLPSGELDPARLSVLADALEEAGCADDDLLGHLRSPGPHVRGCWALDLILGKA
jgi:hypothetical protein